MKNIILGILLILLAYQSRSQDINSSQFYSIPSNINPAFTGFFNHDFYAAASYKNQWSSVTDPYQTVGATAQLSLLKNKRPSSIIGTGIDIVHDRAGATHFNTTNISLSFSYLQVLDKKYSHILGFGIQNGLSFRKFDLSKATFGNQYNGFDGFDPNMNPIENGLNTKQLDYNLAIGSVYSYAPKAHSNLYVGFSAFNLIRPNLSFYEGQENRQFSRFAAMVGGEVTLKGTWSMLPSALFQKQGPNMEIMFGTFARYGLMHNRAEKLAINFGLWYRYMDAIIPAIKMEYKGLNITVNYDINVSKLTKVSRFNGSGEVSISYSGLLFKEHKKPIKPLFCPTMSF
ncbi:MAG TPA: PorP/SprF family type IX secretion system membrane protein [Chitinophagales bacterium]|jgi:type IX secretion system PorP/SprF family membrane protein|nr:PorP/SprF family type IX secretion system membrane protein [Chitinophagales bacterium]MBP6154078.1 PorP/SprF family type IX secretion system membrane protein [Chitinophagales bacterium]HQV78520.1 PorP/SprF family type IX secretion system membrane protein [Chitinophagales bacterium]HQW78794.1 PorP/SprF family type IX secretion system membrane protein [Chitinophagales bacterium]HRB68081.1 PorP/SprF family type IX secretion system membrane protein [Chitinophagales bacterium]